MTIQELEERIKNEADTEMLRKINDIKLNFEIKRQRYNKMNHREKNLYEKELCLRNIKESNLSDEQKQKKILGINNYFKDLK